MPLFYGTYWSGLFAHSITVFPWLLGGLLMMTAAPLALLGYTKISALIVATITVQYLIKIPEWPAFSEWFSRLSARSYYKRCTLEVNLKDLNKEKTLLCYHPHGEIPLLIVHSIPSQLEGN
jgi:hypothetical protein